MLHHVLASKTFTFVAAVALRYGYCYVFFRACVWQRVAAVGIFVRHRQRHAREVTTTDDRLTTLTGFGSRLRKKRLETANG